MRDYFRRVMDYYDLFNWTGRMKNRKGHQLAPKAIEHKQLERRQPAAIWTGKPRTGRNAR